MNILNSIALGLVQGISEFLPVSSSGHLVMLSSIFGIKGNIPAFVVALHFATALATIIVLWNRIIDILKALPLLFKGSAYKEKNKSLMMIWYIIIGIIPAAIAGLLLKDRIESLFSKPLFAAVFLIITGLFLLSTKFIKEGKKGINIYYAIIIGIFQAIAILPGISRSGATIGIALLIGINRKEAGEFSFLVSLPAIFGAMLIEAKKIAYTGSLLPIMAGFVIALISGIIALKLLLKFVKNGRLYTFSFYCIVIGIMGVIYFG